MILFLKTVLQVLVAEVFGVVCAAAIIYIYWKCIVENK